MDNRGIEFKGKFGSFTELFDWLSELPDDSLQIFKRLIENELFLRRHGAD